jgi:hypothetical protein
MKNLIRVDQPIAMEPRRNPMRNMHRCNRRRGNVGRVEDHQIGGLGRSVDHIADHPALALGRILCARHEYELAGDPAGAEIVLGAGAGLEVMPIERVRAKERSIAVIGDADGPGEAVVLAEPALVGARELLCSGVDGGALY